MGWLRLSGVLVVGFLLACSGMKEVASDTTICCSVDDTIEMTQKGVLPHVIVDAIHTSGTDLELSATDITRMSEASVDATVIDALNGGPCVCMEPEVEPEPVAAAATPRPKSQPEPAGLRLAVKYNGGRSFELVNLSGTTYTGVTVLVNNEYQYRMKKLPAYSSDNMRLVSFTSRKTGAEGKKVKMKSIHVSAAQGTYSRSF